MTNDGVPIKSPIWRLDAPSLFRKNGELRAATARSRSEPSGPRGKCDHHDILFPRQLRPRPGACHDHAAARAADLDQLEQIAGAYATRASFLTELTLDPPQGTSAEAGPPHLDEDYLVLSTIHSAKGQEWDVVFVLNVTDGCIPSDMAVGSREQIEEERRLLYVAMTRARQHLHLMQPLRFFRTRQHRHADGHFLALRSRFIPDSILDLFERRAHSRGRHPLASQPEAQIRVNVAARMREMSK